MFNEPLKPYPPAPYEYKEKIERKYIYVFSQSLQEDDYEDELEEDEEETQEEKHLKELPQNDIHDINLDWLLKQVPEGIDPSQIKMEFGFNASSMAYEDHYIKFYYEVVIPARTAEYELAQKQYKTQIKRYDLDLKAYQTEVMHNKIGAMEEELSRLKKEAK